MKKPSVVSFLITLLLAAAFCTHGNEFVTDTDGNPVEVGGQYIIQTVKTENNIGGDIIVPAKALLPPFCPFFITETPIPNQLGLPVILRYLPGPMEPYVNISYPVTIEFIKSPSWTVCNQFWKVNHSSSSPIHIVLGRRPKSWFKIEKAGDGAGANTYKFTTYIGPVGILTRQDDWDTIPLLAVTNDTSKTLLVKFIKVYDATTATTSTSRVEKLGLRMFPFY